jgi:hypothetical protein
MTTKEEDPHRTTFQGYASPNYTPVPDELLTSSCRIFLVPN